MVVIGVASFETQFTVRAVLHGEKVYVGKWIGLLHGPGEKPPHDPQQVFLKMLIEKYNFVTWDPVPEDGPWLDLAIKKSFPGS